MSSSKTTLLDELNAEPTAARKLRADSDRSARTAQSLRAEELGAPRRHSYAEPTWTCHQCGETVGWREENGPDDDGPTSHRMRLHPCRCMREAGEQARAAYVKEHWQEAAVATWNACRIPPRYRHASFATFEQRKGTSNPLAACKTYAEAFEFCVTNKGLFLVGNFGSGKTHLAIATARRIVERTLVTARFVSVVSLLSEIKANFNRDREDRTDPLEVARDAELLIFDDVGQEMGTDFDRAVIADLICSRYDNCLPTIYTSNQADEQLQQRLGGALVSRLWESCEGVEFTASDFRAIIASRNQA